ncbi:MAG: hypothetical protein IJO34_02810, partial [Akkermansia sp.]|nr:hypothetical protein [Akkermansia sp.]
LIAVLSPAPPILLAPLSLWLFVEAKVPFWGLPVVSQLFLQFSKRKKLALLHDILLAKGVKVCLTLRAQSAAAVAQG